MLQIDIRIEEIPNTFARFRAIVNESHWLKRVKIVRQRIRDNPFLEQYLLSESSVAFAFAYCSELVAQYGRIPDTQIGNRSIYPAIGFATQVLSILETSTEQQKNALIRRIHGAIKNPYDMRAMQLEMLAATHFTRRGYKIRWPETEGIGTFDLLVDGIGSNGLEVECKSISNDKGRKIHNHEALEFHNYLAPHLKEIAENLNTGLAVVMTIPGRLPTAIKARRDLATRVKDQILAAQSLSLNDEAGIRITEFAPAQLIDVNSFHRNANTRMFVDQITATNNRESIIVGGARGGVVIFVMQSRQDDSFLKSVFGTLSDSARTQVTGTRAAQFFVGFQGIDSDGLLRTAQQDADPNQGPTQLARDVSKFLNSADRPHVVGVGFVSQSERIDSKDNLVENRGTVYNFLKNESTYWHNDFKGMFGQLKW
ncbi:hypothetical protein [Duganella sp. Dugasp56]|uniref:hypothetical protein n=1 Tax=Duganella sp. Dugasp56 TaxID=3243046 RepID=UPI0039AF7A98